MRSSYFQAYRDHFWQWEEGGEVLAIPDGSTIAYKKEITELLEKIGTEGLPRFGALLLALIAVNPKGKENLSFVFSIAEKHSRLAFSDYMAEAKVFLNHLAEIPEDYKKGRTKVLILSAIFKNCHNSISAINLRSIVHQMRLYSIENDKKPEEINNAALPNDIRIISLLNRKFPTSQSIIDALSEIPEIEENLVLEVEVETEPKGLIDELTLDHRTQQVGALVKTIWSGINLPFHSSIPSQQPIGGVSDLSNKGTFDQLLISEYANDDVIFLSRLANNEVLYLNRESPPTTNELNRVLLIDISLKNWGTPKIISFATMLAIAKHPKSKIDCQVFVIGNTVNQVEIDSLLGIVDGLEFVEASLNAGNGLKKFFENNPATKGREVFVLTERSTPLQNTFHQAISEYGDQIDYWVYTDGEGKIDLYKKLKKSKKHIQHLELPLNRLWSVKRKEKKKVNDELEDFYPILIAKSKGHKGIRVAKNGEIFLLDKRKNLLRLYNKKASAHDEAWDIFYQNLPNTHGEFEVGVLKNGDYLILTIDRTHNYINLINSRSKEIKQVELGDWKLSHSANFVFREDKFFHYNMKGAWSIDLNGEISETTDDLDRIFEQRETEIKEIERKFASVQQVVKNVRRVAINSAGNLVINNFELVVNKGGHIKLDLAHFTETTTLATKERNTTFRFDDGSVVEIDQAGIIILRSSNKSIPNIYFPSIIDAAISIATPNAFAGMERFRKSPKYELILNDKGSNILGVVKFLREITDFGLLELRTMVESTPHNLLSYFSKERAMEAKNDLTRIGAKAEIIETNPGFNELEKIEPVPFFEQYIAPFINTILSHGNKN